MLNDRDDGINEWKYNIDRGNNSNRQRFGYRWMCVGMTLPTPPYKATAAHGGIDSHASRSSVFLQEL